MISNQNESDSPWNTIQNDKYLSQFITSTVEEGSADASASVQAFSLTASEQLVRLTKGIHVVEKELQSLIGRNYGDLISQGTGVYKLETSLEIIRCHVQELLASVDNVRQKFTEPYDEIKKQCLILTRLHDTSNLLRAIDRVQKLAKNINDQEMLQVSVMIREVDEFCQDIDLSGIHIIENDRKMIENERQKIWSNARKTLVEALAAEDKKLASVSIQVFVNLKVLEREVNNSKESAVATILRSTKTALDIQSLMNQATDSETKAPKFKSPGPGRITGGTFPGVNVVAFRSKLWSNWANLLENIVYPRCSEMYLLQLTIISQSQSSLNSVSYENKIDDIDIVHDFWNKVSEILSQQLIAASEGSSFIKQALESEYPKLLRLHTDFTKKLQKLMKKYPIRTTKNTNQLFQIDNQFASLFENAYLSRSVSRLLDFVHGMFPSEGVPTTDDIDKFMRMLGDELRLSFIDENLCRTVAKNIGKAIRVFCINSERSVVHDGNSSQIIDVANATQLLNVNVANTVLYMKQETQKIFAKVPPKLMECCRSEITKELSHADDLVNNIMQPLVDSISEAIESIILTLHKESYQGEMSVEQVPCSLYMRELQRFISRTYNDYLKPFQHEELLQKHCLYLANRCVELFLRHICLVRPLTVGGRKKIAEDLKKIEVAIAPICPEMNNLGDNYKLLRAFRPLIAANEPSQIVNSEFVGKVVPYSLVLMFLFSFAPEEIPSPQESCNWSVARLSQWLDNHKSEHERLELVSGALQRYQQNVRQQNKTTFHDVYPVMMNLLEAGFKSLKFRDN